MRNKPHTVLLADRNPRIRKFVQRELLSEGHEVVTAADAVQLTAWLTSSVHLDALVVDPDMPGIENCDHLCSLLSSRPNLPVILHCLVSDEAAIPIESTRLLLIEKNGDSTDGLKHLLSSLFKPA